MSKAWQVITGFLSGKLRNIFYADIERLGGHSEATTRVSAGYVCLAAAVGWLMGLSVILVMNPTHLEAHILSVVFAAICYAGFLRMRAGQDPMPAINALIPLHLGAIAFLSFRHSGVVE